MRRWLLAALVPFLAACQSETMERNATGMWTSPESRAPERREATPEPEPRREEPKGTVVTIPPDVAAAFEEFTSRESTLFADVVEMDVSRTGWLALMSIAVARDAVTRTDNEDASRGVLTITLKRNPGVAPTPGAVPTVRFGNGMRVVGVDRVVIRLWAQQAADRPIWSNAILAGKKAVYQSATTPPTERRGTFVRVTSEIHRVGGAYRFDSAVEDKP